MKGGHQLHFTFLFNLKKRLVKCTESCLSLPIPHPPLSPRCLPKGHPGPPGPVLGPVCPTSPSHSHSANRLSLIRPAASPSSSSSLSASSLLLVDFTSLMLGTQFIDDDSCRCSISVGFEFRSVCQTALAENRLRFLRRTGGTGVDLRLAP